MTELTKFNGTVEALYNITDVELIDLPKLRSLFFMSGLNNVEKVIMVNAGKAEEEQTLKRVWEEGKKKEEEQRIKEWKIRFYGVISCIKLYIKLLHKNFFSIFIWYQIHHI